MSGVKFPGSTRPSSPDTFTLGQEPGGAIVADTVNITLAHFFVNPEDGRQYEPGDVIAVSTRLAARIIASALGHYSPADSTVTPPVTNKFTVGSTSPSEPTIGDWWFQVVAGTGA